MSVILDVRSLAKHYVDANGAAVRAVDDVSFSLAAGEVLGVVGESGCGKTTLGRTIMRLMEPTRGEILLEGRDFATLSGRSLRAARGRMQMIFQDPFGSLNPRHTAGAIIAEPLIIHGRYGDGARVSELLSIVGLPRDAASRYPHEFSGGQRQRIAIARALALEPKIVIADEPVSALDVSIQSQILNLIAELRMRLGLSMLFISHDLSVIRHIADRVAVMYLGKIVEIGSAADVFAAPRHPYTRALLAAAPRPLRQTLAMSSDRRRQITLEGELPDPANPPPGCAFHGRCVCALPLCQATPPVMKDVSDGAHKVACHLAELA
ncbi:oligopeptide/dipeptide ABC transporter ATP-binding protein [Terrarubrum flagellatum]|uniref:ABC transporter ATP-binding protein n=1 Tax=Terrirubrum flagellatum TaxID=2895980 RepID=UPI0031451E73